MIPRMPDERWRFPFAVQAVTAGIAIVNMAVIKVLFVDLYAYPLMVLAGGAGRGAGQACPVLGHAFSTAAGTVELRAGFFGSGSRCSRSGPLP